LVIIAGIAVAVQKIEERGWQGDTWMITPDEASSTRSGMSHAINHP
jgi:hypothetical protein